MRANGVEQWDEIYPNPEVLSADIEAGTLHILPADGGPAASIVLNEHQDKEYEDGCWRYTEGKFLVIHRLCVAPLHQGRGVAKRMMRYAEELARKNGYSAIRLDAFSQNPISLRLYQGLGFQKAGTITFRKGLFYLFEKGVME